MPRGRKTSYRIELDDVEHVCLQRMARSQTMPAGEVRRAQIILSVVNGHGIVGTSRILRISRRHIYKWLKRFTEQGLDGLQRKPTFHYPRSRTSA